LRRISDRDEIFALLNQDPAWSAYPVADLEPGFFECCEWYADGNSLALIFKGLPDYTVLFLLGPCQALLREISLSPAYINVHPEFLDDVSKYYDFPDPLPMWRMSLEALRPARANDVITLPASRSEEIKALYRFGGGDAFARRQVETGYFRGVERDGELVAAAGIHLASRTWGAAAIGNVITHGEYRNQGLAAACTTAVVQALQQDGIHNIVLNVEQRNHTAIRLYERLGFVRHCAFLEGHAIRRQEVD